MTRMALLAATIVTCGCVANVPMRQPVDQGDPGPTPETAGASLGYCPEVFCIGDDGYCDDGIDCLAADDSATTCAHDPDCLAPDHSDDDDSDPAPAADEQAADEPEGYSCEPGAYGTACETRADCSAGMACLHTSCIGEEPSGALGSCIPEGTMLVVGDASCDGSDVLVPFPCGDRNSGSCFPPDTAAAICACDGGTFDCSGI